MTEEVPRLTTSSTKEEQSLSSAIEEVERHSNLTENENSIALSGKDDQDSKERPQSANSASEDDTNIAWMCSHPDSYFQKALAMMLMCLLCCGCYFMVETPGALIYEFEHAMDITEVQIGLLNSIYTWPNIILPVIGGFLIDRVLGLRVSTVLYSCFVVVGNYLTALGAFTNSFPLMVIGRFTFGIGGESLTVAGNTYASFWFKGEALNMVFGMQRSMALFASTSTFQVSHPYYKEAYEATHDPNKALGHTLSIVGLITIISLAISILLGYMDWRKSKMTCHNQEEQPEISLKEIFILPVSLWSVCAICVTFYVTIFPFILFGKKLYHEKFGFSIDKAGSINDLVYLISGLLAPSAGFMIDRIGLNIFFILSANICTLFGHLLLGFTDLNPYVGVSLLGTGYSILAGSLWPLIALILPPHRQGIGFGVVTAIQNLGLSVVSIFAGHIVRDYGFAKYAIFNVCSLALAILNTILLQFANQQYHHNYLNMTTKERSPYEKTDEYKMMMKRFGGEQE